MAGLLNGQRKRLDLNNSCKLSICIPAFENVTGLERAINSILIQTFDDYEIVISDDSRTKDIYSYTEQLGCSKIRYYRSNNKGPISNWNNAFAKARGEYVTLLHHDDWYSDEKSVDTIIRKMDQGGANFAFCESQQVQLAENGEKVFEKRRYIRNDDIKQLKIDWRYLYLANIVGAPSGVFLRRQFVEDNKVKWDENLTWTVDFDYYMQVFLHDNDFICINEPLVCIGESSKQLTRNCEYNWDLQFKEYFYLYKKYRLRNREMKYTRKLLDISNANGNTAGELFSYFGDLPFKFYLLYICDRLRR
ncbi:glycosyltransferase family 2 protein [Butyrivibrio sp.]|jgi:glycosyltransferase involved in cell wall biosynthesis|uniref:glycosyltransferase family 2 protein n=1 Tax=Butyrivibrio sp. TaxID=28121 RepID=UPI0025BD8CC1|nr:glycosyltransferase family 2 protein [Butyrivibrio sp.]